ncbi:TPA: glutamine-hydrolyzing carbamoyl-phosphate synthase small subunit [Candidatus Micrarchaeota archaeon]|nr:glutamine-hydrolyzing carbamoyl-phosphate synthase small subunit [Candidatus Micrarchaeota archaeon]HIH30236.1 glutamine-hydrolyzing carbamoyl-phosphate synthase small subunit [Candidatus Micrarchaeota archaeon]
MLAEKKAVLVLSDGSIFFGKGFGATERRVGEIVFTTNMTGYEESLTDPSYAGQILVSTYPLIGNYGMQPDWCESSQMQVEGYAVRELCSGPRHANSTATLGKRMEDAGIPGIWGIDTRFLVRLIRNSGVMPACLSVCEKQEDQQELLSMARELDYSKINFVEKVSVGEAKSYGKGGKKVVLIDYGVKMGIVRELAKRGLEVVVVPFSTSAEEMLAFSPDGILASNGPGDPALLTKESNELRKLFGKLPIFGICLGNQLLGQAAGAKTYKLKFGHRGGNHPVLDVKAAKVTITTQNHGFAVDEKTLPSEFEVTHRNLIDGTVEGMQHKELPVFAVQYHPEANPGPCDSKYLFDKFVSML